MHVFRANNMGMSSLSLSERIHLLELFKDKDLVLWDDRAAAMEKMFGSRHPAGFFSKQLCKRELNRIFDQPNPNHVDGLPSHPHSKEAAEMWLTFYNEKLREEQEKEKQLFWVGIRSILDLLQKYRAGKYNVDYWRELRDQDYDIYKDNKEVNECVKKFIEKAHAPDLKNVSSTDDLLQLIRGERVLARVNQRATPVAPIRASPHKSPSRAPSQQSTPISLSRATASRQQLNTITTPSAAVEIVMSADSSPAVVTPTVVTRSSAASPQKAAALSPPTLSPDVLTKTNVAEINEVKTRSSRRPFAVTRSTISAVRPIAAKTRGAEKMARALETSAAATGGESSVVKSASASKFAVLASPLTTASPPPPSAAFSASSIADEPKPSLAKRAKLSVGVAASDKTTKTPVGRPPKHARQIGVPKVAPATSADVAPPTLNEKMPAPASEPVVSDATSAASQSQRKRRTRTTIGVNTSSTTMPATTTRSATPSTIAARASERRAVAAAAAAIGVTGTGFSPNDIVPRPTLLNLLRDINGHRVSGIFASPVSEIDVPGYRKAVKRPMDLSTIRSMINSGAIRTFSEFTSIIVLMFANAVMFNSTGHDVNTAAKEMMQKSLQQIMNAQHPCGEFGDVNNFSSYPSGSRRASRAGRGDSTDDI